MPKLISKIIISGTIKTLTGLHIGGTNSAMDIGGTDNMVVRNPVDNKPYIPGSSLKGALRACLDIADNSIETGNMKTVKYETSQNPKYPAVQLFGNSKDIKKEDGTTAEQQPSRVIVRDGKLLSDENIFNNTDLPYTETKTEVVIDRITAKAMPRQIERVPAGAEFELNMVLNVFDGENEKEKQLKNLKRAMKLLEDDYLGGNGSRGYGRIEINVEKVIERTVEFYKGEKEEEIEKITEYFNSLKPVL